MAGATSPFKRSAELYALERQEGLFDARAKGIAPWRTMRSMVYDRVLALPLSGVAVSSGRRVGDALRATLSFVYLLLTARPVELVVKTGVSGLRVRQGDRWLDVHFDPLLATGISHFKLVEINSPQFELQRRAAKFPSHLDPVLFSFWGKVLGTLAPANIAGFDKRVAALLKERMGVEIPPATLRMRVSTVLWQARLYGLLLKRLRPRAVLVSDTGEFGLVLACARAGIPFVELQHGVFDAHHPNAVPVGVEGTRAELLLPDAFVARGAFWLDRLRDTRQGAGCAAPVGSPLIDRARARRNPDRASEALHIVVTSQGLATDALAEWLESAAANAPAELAWRMSIKLHPTFDVNNRSFAEMAKDARITVIGGADEPNVYDLLADADLHLSIASACHFDAASLGVPSMVVPLPGHQEVCHAVDDRSIFIAERPEDVWQLAVRARTLSVDSERFSASDFVRNITDLLDRIAPPCDAASPHSSQLGFR